VRRSFPAAATRATRAARVRFTACSYCKPKYPKPSNTQNEFISIKFTWFQAPELVSGSRIGYYVDRFTELTIMPRMGRNAKPEKQKLVTVGSKIKPITREKLVAFAQRKQWTESQAIRTIVERYFERTAAA
jgi:hypothetical protein